LVAAKRVQCFANPRQRFSPEHLWSDHEVQPVKCCPPQFVDFSSRPGGKPAPGESDNENAL